MKSKSIYAACIAAVIFSCGTIASPAAEPSKEDAALASKMITAVAQSDYEGFVDGGIVDFKKEDFDSIAAKLAPRLKAGFQVTYLGDLNQRRHHVTLWKISFRDGSDDTLLTLTEKYGRVVGFSIR